MIYSFLPYATLPYTQSHKTTVLNLIVTAVLPICLFTNTVITVVFTDVRGKQYSPLINTYH